MWDKFDQTTMGITVKNLKGSSLPDELGGPGRQLKRLQASKVNLFFYTYSFELITDTFSLRRKQ